MLKGYKKKRKSYSHDQVEQADNSASAWSNVRVAEDFPERVSKRRILLYPFLKQSVDGQKTAYLKYDKMLWTVCGILMMRI